MSITQNYIEMAQLQKDPENFLISRLAKTKKGHKALGQHALSYSRIRESFKEMVSSVTESNTSHKLCLHSLRSGGV